MKRRLLFLTLLFSVVILSFTAACMVTNKEDKQQDRREQQIVALNEIEQLAKLGEYEKVTDRAEALQESIRSSQIVSNENNRLLIMCGICIFFLVLVFSYVYFAILRPFEKMKQYAKHIAQGDFNVPLNYERSNYFGEFTWAFDSMRLEITKARSCEQEAILNNKTVIATLSHDIKTPIASIRAYAEGLEVNLDATPEKRAKYLKVLMKKCDEVSKLTNDLFLHSLSDLDKLKIELTPLELCSFMEEAVAEIAADKGDIRYASNNSKVQVLADRGRLLQITENIINNTRKYAKSPVDISIEIKRDIVELHFRDYGKGIPDEDVPFIFDKFYRGKNCGKEQGSGLGLYIVKYITEQMKGTVTLHSKESGLEVVICLPILLESS